MTRILGISGSLRRDSHNTSLLRAAAEAAGPDVQLELYDRLKEVDAMEAHWPRKFDNAMTRRRRLMWIDASATRPRELR